MSEQRKSEPNKDAQPQKGAPKTQEGTAPMQTASWKKLLSKKWVFPAVYMAAAAIILTLMWVYQDVGKRQATSQPQQNQQPVTTNQGQDQAATVNSSPAAVAVTAKPQAMEWPVSNMSQMQVIKPFYDSKDSSEVKQSAMVEYDNTYEPHMGVDISRKDGKPFDVLAAVSGKVTRVDDHALVGNLVEVTSADGTVTIYQSLQDVQVQQGDSVNQGQVIAQAGRNDLEKDEGTHLHFEVRNSVSGAAENPTSLLPAISDASDSSNAAASNAAGDSSATGANADQATSANADQAANSQATTGTNAGQAANDPSAVAGANANPSTSGQPAGN